MICLFILFVECKMLFIVDFIPKWYFYKNIPRKLVNSSTIILHISDNNVCVAFATLLVYNYRYYYYYY